LIIISAVHLVEPGGASARRLLAYVAPSSAFSPDPAEPVREGAEQALVESSTLPRRVLVVDDDAALRLLYRFNLEASGVSVFEAPDGETALQMLEEELPDVVLLDVMMPGIDGWEVARRLAADARTNQLPVIFITARAEEAARAHGRELGAAGYLTKPFNPVSLAAEIESILRAAPGRHESLG
jgi:DNA-binding response OmpR family regulator